MRLLANENLPLDLVEGLRRAGHNVAWIRTEAPGINDESVLARAIAEERILITFDKDFGELAFRQGLPVSSGVILCRISAKSSADVTYKVVDVLKGRQDWAGHFSVIDDQRVRMRQLPQTGGNK
jgi:predicted nuclease of predicted toxin-antitoxin system